MAISKQWDLNRFLTEASQSEDIKTQVDDMRSDGTVARVKQEKWHQKKYNHGRGQHKPKDDKKNFHHSRDDS